METANDTTAMVIASRIIVPINSNGGADGGGNLNTGK